MYQPLRTKLVLLMAINETTKEMLDSISCAAVVYCNGRWLQVLHRRMLMLFYNGPVQKDRKADGIVILTQILSFLSPATYPESAASTRVSLLWRLWLSSVLCLPWEQDVSVSKLLYRLFQGPEVHSLQREWSSAL